MANTINVVKQVSIGGKSLAQSLSLEAQRAIVIEESVAVAQAGTLSTRTNDTDGTLTMDSTGHGIQTGDRLDIYWVGGSCRGATVGTVSGTSVPFTGATGDVLPVATTTIEGAVPEEVVLDAVGDNVDVIALACANARATVVLAGSDDAEDLGRVIQSGNVYVWHENDGDTNPIAGDTIAKAFISHDDESSAQNIQVALAVN